MSTSADLIPPRRRCLSASPTRHLPSKRNDPHDTYELKSIPISPENLHNTSLAYPVDDDSDKIEEQKKHFLAARDGIDRNATSESYMLYTLNEERSVIKKFDRRLVFFIALLYMLSFLDRSSMPRKPTRFSSI